MKQPVHNLNRLVTKFSHIGFTPLDLPRFQPDNWDNWHAQYAKDSQNVVYHPLDVSPEAIAYRSTTHFWGCVPFANIGDDEVNDPTQFFVTPRVHWEEHFPQLWQDIQEKLPFRRVDAVTLWNSKREVKGHKDKHWAVDREYYELMKWPSEIRIEIFSDNNEDVFRIRPKTDTETGAGYMTTMVNEEMATCYMPPSTNSWAFRNECMVHGTKYLNGNKHLLIVRGIFDVDKVEDLLTRSIVKYPQYQIPSEQQEFDRYMERRS